MDKTPFSIFRLILIPSIITLAVTLLRLVGELRHWPKILFNADAGGGGSIVGISWLAFIFAIYFAIRIHNEHRPIESTGRAFGYTFLALAIFIAGEFVFVFALQSKNRPLILASCLICLVALLAMRRGWRAYWDVMVAYALAARIPVVIVMFFAIRGDWGTHYDVSPPFQSMFTSWFTKFLKIGAMPQLFSWIPFTVVFCGLFGVITAVILKRRVSARTA